jgi:hypothetical protein
LNLDTQLLFLSSYLVVVQRFGYRISLHIHRSHECIPSDFALVNGFTNPNRAHACLFDWHPNIFQICAPGEDDNQTVACPAIGDFPNSSSFYLHRSLVAGLQGLEASKVMSAVDGKGIMESILNGSVDTAASFCPLEESLQQSVALSKASRKRLLDEACRLECVASDLRLEADKVEKQAKRMRLNADEARRLEESLEFDKLCLALRRNDSTVTKLPNADRYPAGYGHRLGEALEENTRVAEVDVDVSKLVPLMDGTHSLGREQVLSYITPLLTYIQKGAAMRRLMIRSSSPDSPIQLDHFLMTHVLQVLFGNRDRIDELVCMTPVPILPFARGMSSTMLKTLDIPFESSNLYSMAEMDAIKSAFRESASLESL